MNANTIAGYIGGTKRNQVAALTLASTTETVFSLVTDSGTAPAVLSIPTQTAVLGSSNPLGVNGNAAILQPVGGLIQNIPNAPDFNSASFDGRPFIVKLYGVVTAAAGTGNTVIPALYLGTSATVGNNSVIIKPAASADLSGTSANFSLAVTLRWDSTSQKLNGSYTVQVGNAAPTTAVIGTANTVAAYTGLNFVPTFTFGNAAGGTVNITEYSLEQV